MGSISQLKMFSSCVREKLNVLLSITVFTPIFLLKSMASFSCASTVVFEHPSGGFKKTGTFGIELKDENRPEYFSQDKKDKRRMLLQFWYPSDDTKGLKRAPYHSHPEKFNQDIKKLYGLPAFLVSRLSKSLTDNFSDAPLSAKETQYPVLIFSHGFNGSRFQNNFQFIELVSHGYIVVSIEHSFGASGTVFSDGSYGGTQPLAQMHNLSFSDSIVKTWSDDQIFVIDYLEKINHDPESRLFQRLDLNRLGIFGHSLGGATCAATLTRDSRPKAGINLDGFYYGNYYKEGFTQPFLEIRADVVPTEKMSEKMLKEWQMSRAQYQFLLFDGWKERINSYARNGYKSIRITKANHLSFTDFPLLMPLKWLVGKDIKRIHMETNQHTLDFFHHHLKGL